MAREMEKARKATSPKTSSTSSGPKSPARSGGSPPHKKNVTEARPKNEQQNFRKGGQDSATHDESKRRSPTSQTSPKRSTKHEQPLSYCRLHTEERAIRRAGYNYQVIEMHIHFAITMILIYLYFEKLISLRNLQIASKINTEEIIRRFEDKLSQVMEEREIKMMRKEMVPKAQLMPAFDKPFHPQRQLSHT
ncbi:hypothetical protein TRIUR3_18861 [Triticum urartu]|uniref:TPX2 C-terminal domain-containing protein n=1 Tax=Triticum urartu TaxID=4572 RepID=M8A1B1_TRIUA|nr:hypothetical protein TRIUR3_18861 [Triticum urartu]